MQGLDDNMYHWMIYQTIMLIIITYGYILNEYKFGRQNEAKFSTPFKQCMHAWENFRVAHIVDTK